MHSSDWQHLKQKVIANLSNESSLSLNMLDPNKKGYEFSTSDINYGKLQYSGRIKMDIKFWQMIKASIKIFTSLYFYPMSKSL